MGDRAGGDTWEGIDCDGVAVGGLLDVVDVVEGAGKAVVEDVVVSESERAVAADTESGLDEGTGLDGRVELELMVGGDVANASL